MISTPAPVYIEPPPPAPEDMIPTVEAGRLNYLSVSQLQNARRCLRAWWFDKVRRLPQKERPSQTRGRELHKGLELHLKGHNPAPEIHLLRAIDWLHAEAPIWNAEVPLGTPTLKSQWRPTRWRAGGVPMTGLADAVALNGQAKIADLKTTSHFKWLPRAEDVTNPQTDHGLQLLGYAAALAAEEIAMGSIKVGLLFVKAWGTPDFAPLTGVTTSRQALDAWNETTGPVAARIKWAARQTHPIDIPAACDSPQTDWVCGRFGGCPYLNECNAVRKGSQEMNLIQSLAEPTEVPANGAHPNAVQAPTASTPPTVTARPAPGAAPVLIPPPPVGAVSATSAPAQPQDTPPKRRGRPAKAKPPTTPSDPSPAPSASKGGPAAPLKQDTSETEPKTPPAVQPPPERTPTPVEVPAPEPTPVEAPTPDATPDTTPEFKLYINCVPLNEAAVSLTAYVADLAGALAAKFSVVDIRAAPSRSPNGGDHPLAFGRWRALLGAAARTTPPPPGVYYIIGTDELTLAVADALTPLAASAVLGFRG